MDGEKTYLSNELELSGKDAQYDDCAKRLFRDKGPGAWVLKGTTDEFRDVPLDVIQECIEGPVEVSRIPIHPGNQPESIIGIPTETKFQYGDEVDFDVRFFVVTPDEKHEKIFIDLELQNGFNPGYDLTERGVFYLGQMLSEQENSEFSGSDYGQLKKVYSIWICLNCPPDAENTIVKFALAKEDLYGHFSHDMCYDLCTVVLVCLGAGEDNCSGSQLHQLLGTIFSRTLNGIEKVDILEEKFGIRKTKSRKEMFDNMCNLSAGIREEGRKEGRIEGAIEQLCALVHRGLLSFSNAVNESGLTEEKFMAWMQKLYPDYKP